MNNINYSPKALSDLDEIWEYIAVKLSDKIAADRTIDGILNAVDQLESFPEIGTPLYFDTGLFSGYRYVICNNYLTFYRIAGNSVYIDRIIYGKRDYMHMLFGNIR